MTARFIIGDSREVLADLPSESVDLIMTSPPFWKLRSYLPGDHPDKKKEIGAEPTPGEFVDSLIEIVEACDRILVAHGSMAIELGDSYSGSGGAGGDYNAGGMRDGQAKFKGTARTQKTERGVLPLDKSLCLIPELFRLSLVYGVNPMTGRTTEMWRARNVIRWVRPNPPVGSLADKFRPATSEMVVICKSKDRYFDPDDVLSDTGAPLLDWWNIPTSGYSGAHYAVYPPDLCAPVIKAMCPDRVCVECGKPSERITEGVTPRGSGGDRERDRQGRGRTLGRQATGSRHEAAEPKSTIGWSDCGHNAWRKGVVLDPFAGSGTTLMVAEGHGRDSIGIDIDDRNTDLAHARMGMFLEIEHYNSDHRMGSD